MPDRTIKARHLTVGDDLHLRFAGGDDYFEVTRVEVIPDQTSDPNKEDTVKWQASNPLVGGDFEDICSADQDVDIKIKE